MIGEKKAPKLRFDGFTDKWEKRKLGEHTKLITKGTTPKDKSGHGDIHFVKVENIINGHIIPVSRITVDEHENYLSRSKLEKNDILFSIAGTLGRTALVCKSILPANTNQALAIIRGYDFDIQFLLVSLGGSMVIEYLQRNPVVGAQPNLSLAQIGDLTIWTPSKAEQIAIGNFFHILDEMIILKRQQYEQTANIKKSMLEKMFPKSGADMPEIRFDGFTEPWAIRKLGEHTKLITKGTTPKDKSGRGDIHFVKIENIINGQVIPVSCISVDEHENYLSRSKLEENDILFSIAGTLGRTALVCKSILPANTNQALAIIRGYDFDIQFLLVSLNSSMVFEYLQRNPVVGAQPNLSLAQIGDLTIRTPSKAEQIAIGNFFFNFDILIKAQQQALEKLQNIKNACLSKMFV
ncbi:MAG: restriction endonuclease subunit S [Defluviitaleaceae bacterium]|nr:restriction endonuclease subunit S [Defluviitaleaceae bacterium]